MNTHPPASVGEAYVLSERGLGLSPPVPGSDEAAIVRLTLNRPAQFNALSSEMIAALSAELDALASDPSCRVIVISGAGRAFCAGHDLREMRAQGDRAWLEALFNRCGALMQKLANLPQPVIARVHGIATAAGCQLVAACDLAIAGESARFATSGINLGLFCSTPAVPLVATVGRKAAAEMLYTGEFISAARAEAIGLVNRAVPDAALDSELGKLALAIARQSAHALASGKRLLARLRPASEEAYRLAAANMAADMGSQDACAGIDAFIAKAPRPAWAHR